MSLITYTELCEEVQNGLLVAPATNEPPYNEIDLSQINGASIDVRLGRTFLRESQPGDYTFRYRFVDLKEKEQLSFNKIEIPWGDRYYLPPGAFMLAETVEIFNIPNYLAAEFRLKSTPARSALDQSLAVWCDPGWHGSVLTLELKNVSQYHTLAFEAGMKIGQMVFFKGEPVPFGASYAARGQYNNDKEVTQSKGVK